MTVYLIENDVGQCGQVSRASHRRRLILQFQHEVAVVLLLSFGVQRRPLICCHMHTGTQVLLHRGGVVAQWQGVGPSAAAKQLWASRLHHVPLLGC